MIKNYQKLTFKTWAGVVAGGVCCCATCDRAEQGWVKLDADGTMKKGCEPKLQNPMAGHKNMSGRHIQC
eukprot:13969811-Ditylum_brightwellii.AAC.1